MKKHIRNLGIIVIILLIGAGFYFTRGDTARLPLAATEGKSPALKNARKEIFPTVNVAQASAWAPAQKPVAADGLNVERFAQGLDHPRNILRLPNGDILVAETNSPPRPGTGITAWVMGKLMEKAGAGVPSANRITLLRDADKDGTAEEKFTLLENLNSPFGMALVDGLLYVANTDAVYAFPYKEGDTKISAEGRKIANLNAKAPNNHWTRNLIASPDGKNLFIAVGSATNYGEKGLEIEKERANILNVELSTNKKYIYTAGLRNPVGMDYNPITGDLWTVVNERDMLGSDMVPDYLTRVDFAAHYGWPWHFWGGYSDPRVKPKNDEFRQYEKRPDYGLGAHVAALGVVFAQGAQLGQAYANGAFISRHGSWNRIPRSGYDVIFVTFDNKGMPVGKPKTILSGFVDDKDNARGRPTMVALDQTGALLVSDDVGGIIWRVTKKGDAAAIPAAQ